MCFGLGKKSDPMLKVSNSICCLNMVLVEVTLNKGSRRVSSSCASYSQRLPGTSYEIACGDFWGKNECRGTGDVHWHTCHVFAISDLGVKDEEASFRNEE